MSADPVAASLPRRGRRTSAPADDRPTVGAAPGRPAPWTLHDVALAQAGRPVLAGLQGAVAPGRFTAVVGPNGAGKSSLLALLAGSLAPLHGRVERAPGLRVAHLPQQAGFDRGFPLAVHEVAALGLWPRLGAWRGLGRAQRAQVDAALDRVGLAALATRPVAELSSGQWQRVLFARLLLQDADAVLLDEPFNALDAATTADLLGLIDGWVAAGRSVVAVLHDRALVRRHAQAVIALSDGRCVAWGPVDAALGEPVADVGPAHEAWALALARRPADLPPVDGHPVFAERSPPRTAPCAA